MLYHLTSCNSFCYRFVENTYVILDENTNDLLTEGFRMTSSSTSLQFYLYTGDNKTIKKQTQGEPNMTIPHQIFFVLH